MNTKHLFLIIMISACSGMIAPVLAQGLIIGHMNTDLTQIPAVWIDAVKANTRIHYAHTSHGSQVTTGLERLYNADANYHVVREISNLPNVPGAVCMFDGQEYDDYITPDMYWQGEDALNLTRNVLNHNPTINYSMWAWCTQLDYYGTGEVQQYLNAIIQLKTEFPYVTFICMTGNAQSTGWDGFNRYQNNNQIRQYCMDNDIVLFDFADLDSWWYDPNAKTWNQATETYDGTIIPVEHPNFHGDDEGSHTTYESCEQKASAFWWMMARLAGWDGTTAVEEGNAAAPSEFMLSQNYPNPFNPSTEIAFRLPRQSHVTLCIHDVLGNTVRTLLSGIVEAGMHSVPWDGKDDRSFETGSGVYYYRLQTDSGSRVRKMIKLK